MLGSADQLLLDPKQYGVKSSQYCLCPGDLRDPAAMQAALEDHKIDPTVPTYVLFECVLVYMEPEESSALLAHLSSWLQQAMVVIYEQIRPDDAFGRQMVSNLLARGAPLRGLPSTPTLVAHEQRLSTCGWPQAWAIDMDTIYSKHLPPEDKKRIERLEMFDEFEEWHMIQEHYCVACGSNS